MIKSFVFSLFLLATSSANATEMVQRNVSYDDCTVAHFADMKWGEFIKFHPNIFEALVLDVGHIPHQNGAAANECWATLQVNKWYKTSVGLNKVYSIIHADPTKDMLKDDSKLYCPVHVGESYLIFAGDYATESGTGNTSFYLNACSLYVPKKNSSFFVGLINSVNNNMPQ